MILKVNQLPDRLGGKMVATVGELQNEPNSRNVIPGKVHFTVDIRSWEDARAMEAWKLVRKDFEDLAARWGCTIKIEETWRVGRSLFDEKMVQGITDIADTLGYSSLPMVSESPNELLAMGPKSVSTFAPRPTSTASSVIVVEPKEIFEVPEVTKSPEVSSNAPTLSGERTTA